ncbi:MAG: nuclear transport factor 2 family protein [Vicinamibacteria bacterium]
MVPMLLIALVSFAETPPEVARFLGSFIESFSDLEWDRFRDHFSDEATVFFPTPYPRERASGRAAVEEGFRGVFERWRKERPGPPYLDIRPLDVMVQSYGEIHVVTFHLADGESRSRRTFVLGKVSGELKILHLHASSQ